MSDSCFLCKRETNLFLSNYNIDLTFTKCTNKLLRVYLTDIFKNTILIIKNSLICNICKDLIDDLDYAENSYKEIRTTVWNYLGYNVETCSVYCQTENVDCKQLELASFEAEPVLEVHKQLDIKCTAEAQNQIKQEVEEVATKKCSDVLKPYQCTKCPKMWKTLGELKGHQSSHSDVRPFICEICGQSYKKKTALDVHVGMHNGIYPFMCLYCKKTFTQKGALQRHLPIHTGDTPYQCDLCGKRFVHHTSFNIHRLSHTGQKDYKCLQCGLALLSASHLKRHMRVHTGEKNFACNLCDKRFAQRYNLVSHQKLHEKTSDGAYKRNHRCPLCSETFNRRLKLDEHMVQEHQKII